MCMSSTHNRSTVLQCFECGNAIKIRNRIKFGFYPGLPHVQKTFEEENLYELAENTIFMEKTFANCLLVPRQKTPCMHIPKFCGETFTKPRNSRKFSPSFESFPLHVYIVPINQFLYAAYMYYSLIPRPSLPLVLINCSMEKHFRILQVIKTGGREGLGMRLIHIHIQLFWAMFGHTYSSALP